MRFVFSFILLALVSLTYAQEPRHFLVELEVRTPGEQDMVRAFEGFPSIPFQANDIKGNQIDLMGLKGKTVIMYFWEINNSTSTAQMDALNLLQSRYRDDIQIVSFAYDGKTELIDYIKSVPLDFPIIPNSKTLAEGPYGSELGTPKIFIIDEFGVIKWVFPESAFGHSAFDTYKVLETLVVQLNK